MEEVEEELLDDCPMGITFKSFEIEEVLGEGTFGKVFRVKRRDEQHALAMKVLNKKFLVKNNHLRYAISECNILKLATHPFVLKMHYAF